MIQNAEQQSIFVKPDFGLWQAGFRGTLALFFRLDIVHYWVK